MECTVVVALVVVEKSFRWDGNATGQGRLVEPQTLFKDATIGAAGHAGGYVV